MPAVARQLSLGLSQPIDHHERLHAAPQGAVIYWERARKSGRWTKIRPDDPVAQLVTSFQGRSDTFLTVNQFHGWRLVRLLQSLRCCYVDIDGSADLEHALDLLAQAKLPAPSFAVFSGRGLHLYWTIESAPAKALPVWQRVQNTLIKALSPMGADRAASDCTRVLRLVGSENSKNGAEVRGLALTDTVWTLSELADEVLGPRPEKAAIYSLGAEGSRRKGQTPKRRAYTASIYHWWHLVYTDLCAIADRHWFGGIPDGHRDQFLFLMGVALSWFAPYDLLQYEITKTASTFTGSLTEEEVAHKVSAILKRAEMASNGKYMMWNGRAVDARYHYKAETLRELVGDLIPADMHGQLRCLAPAEVIQERKKERDKGRNRVAEGRYKQDRDAYLQAHSDSAEQRAATARLLKAQGKTAAEVATEMGVSRKTVFNYWKGGV
jgi:hypothetical protein